MCQTLYTLVHSSSNQDVIYNILGECGASVSKVAMHRGCIVVALLSTVSVAILSLSLALCWQCSSVVSLLLDKGF